MFKKWIVSLILLLPLLLSAQKIYHTGAETEALLEPANDVRRTSFRVLVSAEGVTMQIMASGKKATLEIFFRTSPDMPDAAYHQFYAELGSKKNTQLKEQYFPAMERLGFRPHADMTFTPHYYWFGLYRNDFPFLGTYKSACKNIEGGFAAELFIPWIAFRNCLPFDENGKGKEWDFTILRSEEDPVLSWQGTFHKPATWGKLHFNDLSEKELKEIYAAICRQAVKESMPVPEFLFEPAALADAKAKQLKALEADAAAADPEKMSREDLYKQVQKTWDDTRARDLLTYLPYPGRNPSPLPPGWTKTENAAESSVTYTFKANTGNAVWLQKLAFRPGRFAENELNWEVTGRNPAKGVLKAQKEFRPPVLLSEKGADEIRFTVKGKNGKLPQFGFSASLFAYRFGFKPLSANPADAGAYPEKPDGTVCYHNWGRNLTQQLNLLLREPVFIMGGNGMLDGLDPMPLYESRVCKDGVAGDMSMVGSGFLYTLWRIRNLRYNMLPVKTYVLYPAYSSHASVEANVESAKKCMEAIREQLPHARIVLVGEVPGKNMKGVFKDTKTYQINQAVAQLADGKTVIYADPAVNFLNPDGTLKPNLWSSVFPTVEGYNLWLDVVMPLIQY